LLNFIKRMRRWPREVRLVHGEDHARQAFKVSIEAMAQKTLSADQRGFAFGV
jgi:metallo-beta-lactamase family protein